MSVMKTWELLPSSDLANRANWRSLGHERYAALRATLLVVASEDSQHRYGAVIEGFNVAPGDTIEVRRKREQVISRTTTISEAVRFATTSRVCEQLSTKLGAELSSKVPGFSGKLTSEILSHSEYEITKTTEVALNTTTSHLIQETEGDEHVITLEGSESPRDAKLRRRYWPRRWDVYMHSYEYLELSYKRSWFWWQVRETIKKTDSGALGWPLVSLVFYQPQAHLDVCYIPVPDELDNPDGIQVQVLSAAMPASNPPHADSLEDLAKLAFPVTKAEKAKAAGRTSKKHAYRKGGARKFSAKKAPARRMRKMARKRKK